MLSVFSGCQQFFFARVVWLFKNIIEVNPLLSHIMFMPLSCPPGVGNKAIACNGGDVIAEFQLLTKTNTDLPDYSQPVSDLQPSLIQGPEKNQQ